ncbi:MAG: hypothetical protein ACNA7W_07745 [Pseudomonadales bacterium]
MSSLELSSPQGLEVRSFFQQRGGYADEGERASGNRLLGIQAASPLPVSEASAEFEYAVSMPMVHVLEGFTDESNQLLRLRLENRWRELNYGVRFFSIGEAFAQNPVASARLRSAGLPGPGDGAEIWSSWRFRQLQLDSTARRLERSLGDRQQVEEYASVTLARNLGEHARLLYLLESSTSTSSLDPAARPTDLRQRSASTVKLNGAQWSVFWRAQGVDQAEVGRLDTASTWELGARLNMSDRIAISPRVKQQTDESSTAQERTLTTTALRIETSWLGLPELDVNLQHRAQSGSGPTLEGLAADVALRTPLGPNAYVPPGVTMSAALSFRDSNGSDWWEDGVGFRMTLQWQPDF